MEPDVGSKEQCWRYFVSGATVVFMICLVSGNVLSVYLYRSIAIKISQTTYTDTFFGYKQLVSKMTAAMLNLMSILVFEKIYYILANTLTDFELPRAQTEWENSYILKLFVFQFFNNNAALFYTAFFKDGATNNPAEYRRWFGYRLEDCGPEGSLFELCFELVIIFVGRQALNNVLEVSGCVITNYRRSKHLAASTVVERQIEKDYNLMPMENLDLIHEYVEMIIQYVFVTVYIAAFPLAPLFALINNIFHKLLV